MTNKNFTFGSVDEALRYPEPYWHRMALKIRIMISLVYLSNFPSRLKGIRRLSSVKYTDHSEGRGGK